MVDFQHREGSKTGSGGLLSDAQAALDRKERLRKLALETIDITKDPYFMKNHLGTFECKLCLTLHPSEGNYLSHTQGKRHQSNLGRRAAMEAKNAPQRAAVTAVLPKRQIITIGRPGYKITKSRGMISNQRILTFEVDYTECSPDIQPRHRFMSAYEQKIETPNKNYQYLVIACEPYDTISFKIPSDPIDKGEGKFYANWDERLKKFVIQLHLMNTQ
jgi:splicing factor 3A subunit 2